MKLKRAPKEISDKDIVHLLHVFAPAHVAPKREELLEMRRKLARAQIRSQGHDYKMKPVRKELALDFMRQPIVDEAPQVIPPTPVRTYTKGEGFASRVGQLLGKRKKRRRAKRKPKKTTKAKKKQPRRVTKPRVLEPIVVDPEPPTDDVDIPSPRIKKMTKTVVPKKKVPDSYTVNDFVHKRQRKYLGR